MKKHTKLALLSTTLLLGASTLAGCGSSFNGLTINFWHTFGQGVTKGVTELANQFAELVEQHDGVKIRIKLTNKGGYDDILGKIGKSFADASNPTIAVAYPDHIANYFAAEKTEGEYVVNLQPFVDSDDVGFGKEGDWLTGDDTDESDFNPQFWAEGESYTKDGIYSVPFLKSTEVMLYNMTLLSAANDHGCFADADLTGGDDKFQTEDEIRNCMNNITWDEFMDLCDSIVSKKTLINKSLKWPVYYDSDSNLMISRLYQDGIPYSGIDANRHGYIGFNGTKTDSTPEQIQAYADVQALLKKYKQWYDRGIFSTKGVVGEYSSNFFPNDQIIFAIGSSGGSGYSLPKREDFNLGSCKVPYSNGNPLYVSQGPTLTLLHNKKLVNSGKDDDAVKYAWKFLKYITASKSNAYLCAQFSEGYIPVKTSALTEAEWLDYIGATTAFASVTNTVMDHINGHYFSTPVFQGSSELRNQIEGCFADVMKLGKNPSAEAIKGKLDTAIKNTVSKM